MTKSKKFTFYEIVKVKCFIYSIMKPKRITGTDKNGNSFGIEISCTEDLPFLLEMYRTFSPRPASQGLPPQDIETCHNWVKNLFKIGENILAWRGDSVIGHAALVPDVKGKSGEFVIFVDKSERNLGIGTYLTRFTLEKYRQLCFDSIWLTVSVTNFLAIKLYRKLGFEFCDMDNYERTMIIKLR
jgi:diamine N-acetyltransferase